MMEQPPSQQGRPKRRQIYVHRFQRSYALGLGFFLFGYCLILFGLAFILPSIMPAIQLLSHSSISVTRPENTVVPSGATPYSPGVPAAFTATATGNIDADPALDQWHVNETRGGLVDPDADDSTG